MNCARMTRQEQYEQRLADYNQRKLRHYKNKRRLIAKLEKSGIDLKDGILNEDFDELRPHPDDD